MATGKDEAISAFPVGIIRIVLDEVLVQRVGDGRQGDGGAGVAGAAFSTASAERTFAILMRARRARSP